MQSEKPITPSSSTDQDFQRDENEKKRNKVAIQIRNLDFFYGENQVLHDVNLDIAMNQVMAFIGPSGCGKTTLLRVFNRMNELIEGARVNRGKVLVQGTDIYSKEVDVIELRKKVGMVCQKSNPFPKSVYQNIAYGLQIQGIRKKRIIDQKVEESLSQAALWDEVKDLSLIHI